ncbi:MAG: hypothetical protein ACKO7W_16145 [Elainella sp.]
MLLDKDNHVFYSSVVLEYVVPNQQNEAFQRWYGALIRTAEAQAGFLRADPCPPLFCVGDVVKWYSIVHFDTPAHLNQWLNSPDWKIMLESGQEILKAYKFKSFTTGLEGWFASGASSGSLGPPSWKQILSVVLGLYPTILIQGLIFSALGIMQDWPQTVSLLINNLITSSALTWLVMPQISRLLRFWLQPAYRNAPLRTNLIGAALVLTALGMMVIVFHQIQSSLGS